MRRPGRGGFYWEKLGEGGDEKARQCGRLEDKYGVSWQVVPVVLMEMLNDPDKQKSEKVMKAMLQMKKIDISELKRASAEQLAFIMNQSQGQTVSKCGAARNSAIAGKLLKR